MSDSRCQDCGACVHDIILNRVCVACGLRDPEVTVKPAAPDLVPADRLRRRD